MQLFPVSSVSRNFHDIMNREAQSLSVLRRLEETLGSRDQDSLMKRNKIGMAAVVEPLKKNSNVAFLEMMRVTSCILI